MIPKRINCCAPWLARFSALVVITTGDRFTSFVFVHDVEVERTPRPSLHRLFG